MSSLTFSRSLNVGTTTATSSGTAGAASIRVTSAGRLSGAGATAAPRAIEGPGSFFSILSSDRIIIAQTLQRLNPLIAASGGCAAAVS